MKLKEFVNVCGYYGVFENFEIIVHLLRPDSEYSEILFSILRRDLDCNYITEHIQNAKIISISAKEKNKFSVIIQPDNERK